MLGIRELRIGRDSKGWWNTYLNHSKNRTIKELIDEMRYAYRVDHDRMLKSAELKQSRKMAKKCLRSSGYNYKITVDYDVKNIRKYTLQYCQHPETGRYKFTWEFKNEYLMNRFIIDKLLMEPLMFPLHRARRKKYKKGNK